MKRAFITGITGQDGSYLAEFLLQKGYEVHGMVRRSSTLERNRIDHLKHSDSSSLHLHYGDMADGMRLVQLVHEIDPDEIYNLAAQSHVHVSFALPEYTSDITGLGTLRLLEAVRQTGKIKKVRFYQASSSEMYGAATEFPQKETTPFHPQSPYACAKVFAHSITQNYRHAYGLFAVCGILFNHESPRRAENFVTRKITRAVGRIHAGLQKRLSLGNLNTKRDWGYAKEYVEAMWLMLQQDTPEDYVIATGASHSITEFLDAAFGYAQLDWRKFVDTDSQFLRPSEVNGLAGDFSKAKQKLGWEPKTKMPQLVQMMVEHDIELALREKNSF